MGNSLQEQMLKAGLVTEQQVKQTRSKKGKAKKRRGGAADPEAEAQRKKLAAERAAKAERDRALNREREEEVRRKAEENEIRQMIHEHRISRDGGEIAFNFTDGSALKRLYVKPDQQQGLVKGKLAVVRQDTFYEIVPREVAERLRSRKADLILVLNDPAGDEAAGEDEYAEYKVPDDLMW